MSDLKSELLKIATYHSDDGTSGYALDDSQVEAILNLFRSWALGWLEEIKTPALINDEPRHCQNCGDDLGLEYYDAFDDGFNEAKAEIRERIKRRQRNEKS